MSYPEPVAFRRLVVMASRSSLLESYAIKFEQCRLDGDFACFVYRSALLAIAAAVIAMAATGSWLLWQFSAGGVPSWTDAAIPLAAGIAVGFAIFYFRLYSISSLRNYRGALIDANAIHAVGLMLAMAGYNVPLKRMLLNLSRMGSVYGEDIALEAAHALALIEEDGMDVISALRLAR